MGNNVTKQLFNQKPVFGGSSKLTMISIGVVKSIDDDGQAGRIIVEIKGVDENIQEVIPAFPFFPKHLQIMPKIGESVFVIKLDLNDSNFTNRFWIGPIISQPQKLQKDLHYFTSQAALPGGTVGLEVAPKFIPEAKGIFPNESDVSLQGRDNSDLILKSNELLLRAGQHKISQPLVFNNENMGVFQIKYNTPVILKGNKKTTNLTVANIVADKINLITHTGDKKFNILNQTDIISDEIISDFINKAHPLPYGDTLIDFLKAAKAFILNHTHAYPGLPAISNNVTTDNFVNFNLDTINSKNININ